MASICPLTFAKLGRLSTLLCMPPSRAFYTIDLGSKDLLKRIVYSSSRPALSVYFYLSQCWYKSKSLKSSEAAIRRSAFAAAVIRRTHTGKGLFIQFA
jgi:hypothetical protein